MPNIDPYYNRPEVSNSDLTWLKKYWMTQDLIIDLEAAFRFGRLVDALITEPRTVNYYKHSVGIDYYTAEEFQLAEEMKSAFMRDPFCNALLGISEFQTITVKDQFKIEHDGFSFSLPFRIKMDLNAKRALRMGADVKSTCCTTQKQFEESVRYFEYHRQGAVYTDVDDLEKFMIIGISKVNRKVFKVPMERGKQLYNDGKSLYQELAFRWWYLFQDLEEKNICSLVGYEPSIPCAVGL